MALVNMKKILDEASNNNYAVPAFNIDNMEITQAILEVAVELSSPLILAIGQGAINDGNMEALAAMVRRMGNELPIAIALHLDHCSSFGQIIKCIKEGFTSVMIDGSHLPLNENINLTQKVIEVVNSVNVSVEAELGKIFGVEDDIAIAESDAFLVDIKDVKEFISHVSIDALAIAIGNAHGLYKGEPKLNLNLLSDINKLTDIPLVLHGGSGIPDVLIKKAIELGINKINIGTEVRHAFIKGFLAGDNTKYDIYRHLNNGRKGVKELVKDKILLFGCQNRCKK
jgi:ketose-bisphosphate aldolase